MFRGFTYALIPLAVLVSAITLACLLGYVVQINLASNVPLHKIISKITQILLVLSIFPAMRYAQLDKTALGFARRAIFIKQIAQGFGLGFVILLPVFILIYVLNINSLKQNQDWLSVLFSFKTLIALVLALLISLIEEPLFRGMVLIGLRKKLAVPVAVSLSAFYYAAPHFLARTNHLIPIDELNVFSGFALLAENLTQLAKPDHYAAFCALLMVGLFLSILRCRLDCSLGWCIGCHTCWVWQIKLNKSLFNTNYTSDYGYLVSHYDGVIGWLVAAWLLFIIGLYFSHRRLMR